MKEKGITPHRDVVNHEKERRIIRGFPDQGKIVLPVIQYSFFSD